VKIDLELIILLSRKPCYVHYMPTRLINKPADVKSS
jgi:hypothetical protein